MANGNGALLSQGVVVLILFLLASVGNGILIVAYWRDHRMRTPTNMLVISHSTAEFSFAITGILVYASSLIRLKVPGGGVCFLAGTVNMFLFFVSILSLAAISVDRYFAVVKRSRHKFTKKTVKRILIVIWSQALVSAVPWDQVFIQKPGKRFIAWVLGNCEKYLTLREHHNVPILTLRVVLWIVSFFIPCCIIFYASVRILRNALRKRVRVHVLEFRGAADAYSKSAFTTIIIIVVYFLCLIPSAVLFALRKRIFGYYSITTHSIAKVAMSFRSVCYPVIFIARNRKFSSYVRSFLARRWSVFRCSPPVPCFSPPQFRSGTCDRYRCSPRTGRTCNACGINALSIRRPTMFRGAPPKLAFTDMNEESSH